MPPASFTTNSTSYNNISNCQCVPPPQDGWIISSRLAWLLVAVIFIFSLLIVIDRVINLGDLWDKICSIFIPSPPKIHCAGPDFTSLRKMEGFNYSRHIDFLEKHFVTPFLNRALYRNSGQIRDKIPFGLVLYGEDKVAKNLLVAALKYELGIRGENYFCTRKPNRWQQIYDAGLLCSYGNYVAIRCIKDAQLVQNSMIYLEDIDESSSNRDICCDFDNPFQLIFSYLHRLIQGDTLVVMSVTEMDKHMRFLKEDYNTLPFKFYHVSDLKMEQIVKNFVLKGTSTWDEVAQPSSEILDLIVDKVAPSFTKREEPDPSKICYLCESVYKRCLDRMYPENGKMKGRKLIKIKEIAPTREDWEEGILAWLGDSEKVDKVGKGGGEN